MRARAMRLQEHGDQLCNCGCGLPMAEAHKDQPFKVDVYVDYAHRAIERFKKIDRANAERAAKEAGGKLADDWENGRRYFALLPDQSELREGRRGD